MKKFLLLFLCAVATAPDASAFLGFGGSGGDAASTNKPQRLSVLMRKANDLFDEAEELAAERKRTEALAKYRETVAELEELKRKYPEQTDSPVFRNRLLHCMTRIDAYKLEDSSMSTYPVSVTDTTELQKKYDEKHGRPKKDAASPAPPAPPAKAPEPGDSASAKLPAPPAPPAKALEHSDSASAKSAARARIRAGDVDAAHDALMSILRANPQDREALYLLSFVYWTKGDADHALQLLDYLVGRAVKRPASAAVTKDDAPALVLFAEIMSARDDFRLARNALDLAMRADPKSPVAYFNMAILLSGDDAMLGPARSYYELGLKMGGARDISIEKRLEQPGGAK